MLGKANLAAAVGPANPIVTEADCKAKGQAKTRAALIACLAPNRRVVVDVTGTTTAP